MTDLKYALRQLLKHPGFTAVAVLTLALGIGVNTALFSALRALVLRPFSYPQADQLVHVWSSQGQPLSVPDYLDISAQAKSFADFGVYDSQRVNLGGEHAQSIRSVSCTPGVLRAFGVRPALGRQVESADCERGAPPVAVISHRLWQQSFAGDPKAIGLSIRVDGIDVTVVGIMPAGFEFASPWMRTETCDLWRPLQFQPDEMRRSSHWLCAIGRLKEGVTLMAADAEIKAIGGRLKAAYPDTNANKPFLVRSLNREMTGGARQLWLLFGAAALVLLVACANVASMLLARGAQRHGEFGVRLALGATRRQMLQLPLSESLLLACLGTLGGLALAVAGLRVFQSIAPVTDARKAAMVLDGGVLAFTIGVTLVTALLAGLPTALAARRVAVADLLRADARGATGSQTRHRFLRGLIIAQVAVAFILANGAALFSASYTKLLSANTSLTTDRVLSAELNLRGQQYEKSDTLARFCEQLVERVAALPGVTTVGTTSKLPLEGGSNMSILVNDEVFGPGAQRPLAEVSAVTPGYFAAAGIPLLQGRTLGHDDVGTNNIGVVVNRALAEKCWPGEDAIGKIIRPDGPLAWFHARVVGVVENVRQWSADSEPLPEIYWTADRAWGPTVFLIVRSPQSAAYLAPALRHAVAELDPDLSLSRVRTFRSVVDQATQAERVVAGLVDFFMALALVLVAVGLYGTLSYLVLQRSREFGVRMALGASQPDITRLVLRHGSGWVLVGVTLGIGGTLALDTALQGMVYGMSAINLLALAGATGVVTVTAAVAAWLPARRASRVDPMTALRSE